MDYRFEIDAEDDYLGIEISVEGKDIDKVVDAAKSLSASAEALIEEED